MWSPAGPDPAAGEVGRPGARGSPSSDQGHGQTDHGLAPTHRPQALSPPTPDTHRGTDHLTESTLHLLPMGSQTGFLENHGAIYVADLPAVGAQVGYHISK